MKTKELERYRELSKEIRKLPGQLAAALGDARPIGHQLFLCRDLKNPLGDEAWARLLTANEGKLPKEMAAWEMWDRFPDRTGCSRFFGCGNREDVGKIKEIVRKADTILADYEKLDHVPEELEWGLPNAVRFLYDCCLPEYYNMLELLSRCMGWGDDSTIVVEQAGLEVRPLNENDLFWRDSGWGEPSQLEQVGLELLAVSDFASGFAKAIEKWVPWDATFAEYPCDPVESTKPTAPVVESVTIKNGHDGFVLHAKSLPPLSIAPEHRWIMLPFIKRVVDDAPGEIVPWNELHKFLNKGDAIPTKACDRLRKLLDGLRAKLLDWGRPPAGKDWIVTQRKRGAHLNTSCQWKADKEIRKEYGRKAESVFLMDPHTLEENTPNRGQRLPSRSRRHKRRDYDE